MMKSGAINSPKLMKAKIVNSSEMANKSGCWMVR